MLNKRWSLVVVSAAGLCLLVALVEFAIAPNGGGILAVTLYVGAIAVLVLGPVFGVGWTLATFLRKSSLKELLALTAYWALIAGAWVLALAAVARYRQNFD